MHRRILLALAGFFLAIAVGALLWQLGAAPTTLRVAVGPQGSEDVRVVAALATAAARERETVRLQVVITKGPAESAKALDEGRADLAVVRGDIAVPENGQTVAIMHRNAVVIMTPPGSELRSIADLKDRSVGIMRDPDANGRVLEALLAFYEVPRDRVRIVPLAGPRDAEEAFRSRSLDAVMAVGTLGGRVVSGTYAAALAGSDGIPPGILPVPEAEAVAQRSAMFETFDILRGAFGGALPRPSENLRTVGVSHRLVAQSDLPDNAMSELARIIFAVRPRVAQDVPLANRIEAPDTSKSSSFQVHPGAAAFYDGEVQTFFERYSDWIYVGVMVLSLLGSAFAGFASTVSAKRQARTLGHLDRLSELVGETRRATSQGQLDAIEREADHILSLALGRAGAGALDQTAVAAFSLGLDQLREALESRRALLKTEDSILRLAAE